MINAFGKTGKRIVFVRHGESIGNAKGLDDNSLEDIANHDFPLSDRGSEQAEAAGRYIIDRQFNFDASFVSTYLRTLLTHRKMRIVAPNLSVDAPIEDARLDEWWRGIWHTMTSEEIDRYYPLERKIMSREGWYHYRAPGGQNGPDVELQIRSFLNDFLFGAYRHYGSILISGHGKWGIMFWKAITGASVGEAEYYWKQTPFGNCSISLIDGNGFNRLAAGG